MSEREYARHRGCARSSVQAARRTGRLRLSVTTDEEGRISINPDLADREWKRNTQAGRAPLTGRTAPRTREQLSKAAAVLQLATPLQDAAEVPPETWDIVLEEIGRPGACVSLRILLEPFLIGAAAALREAGKAPTPEALRAVVVSMNARAWFAAIAAAVNAALDPSVPAGDLTALWQSAGRAAVVAGEADDGNAG